MKRKAAALEDIQENSPTKRRTRSSGSTPTVKEKSPERKRRVTRRTVVVEESLKENESEGDEPVVSTPRKGRPRRKDALPIISNEQREVVQQEPDDDQNEDGDDDDELILSPPKPPKSPLKPSEHRSKATAEDTLTPYTPRRRSQRTKGTRSPSPILVPRSPTKHATQLPLHLHGCLNAQKRAILEALRELPNAPMVEEEESTNEVAQQQLTCLLEGTTQRGEGNSCLLLGPRGSGKTRLVEKCLSTAKGNPIIIRLSGHAQQNDRVAMREIAHQLTLQTGNSFLSPEIDSDGTNAQDEANPFISGPSDTTANLNVSAAHLPSVISLLPTLSRSTIIILDAFDLFAFHARQALLYCLFDTAQSCRSDGESSKRGKVGLAVVGVTTRVNILNELEKRVKSRFSGRMLRCAGPRKTQWQTVIKSVLTTPIKDGTDEWKEDWEAAVDRFLGDDEVQGLLGETFALSGDWRMLSRILTPLILALEPANCPYPLVQHLASAISFQRSRPRFPFLHTLSYPSLSLLIASNHAHTAGHNYVTFALLYDTFKTQVRTSQAAPVQVDGGSIGMVKVARGALEVAFEQLVAGKVFVNVVPPHPSIGREFVRYRCTVGREELRRAVERMGMTSLKKWLGRAS